jgi:hypothetical protein
MPPHITKPGKAKSEYINMSVPIFSGRYLAVGIEYIAMMNAMIETPSPRRPVVKEEGETLLPESPSDGLAKSFVIMPATPPTQIATRITGMNKLAMLMSMVFLSLVARVQSEWTTVSMMEQLGGRSQIRPVKARSDALRRNEIVEGEERDPKFEKFEELVDNWQVILVL